MSAHDARDETTVVVRGSGLGFAQEISARAHHLRADEPIPNGGTDTGPTPYDLLLASLGS
jgi:putative redox protein